LKSRIRTVGAAAILVAATLASAPATSHASAPLQYACAKYGYTFVLPRGWVRHTASGSANPDTCASTGSSPSFTSPDNRMMFGEAVVAPSMSSDVSAVAPTMMRAFFAQMKAAGPAYASGWVKINGVRYFWAAGIVAVPGSKQKMYLHAIDTVHRGHVYLFVGMALLKGKQVMKSDPPALQAAFSSVRFV
jgi:hypothetical protein